MAWTTGDGGHESDVSLQQLGGPTQGLYAASSTQNLPLGFRSCRPDGSVFRYAHFVSAVGAGKLAAVDVSVGNTASIDGKFTDSASAADDTYTTTDNVIYLTDTDTFSTSDAADVFAGGYLHITDAGGEGYRYRIKSNDVGTAAGLMKLELYDNLGAAIASEASCSITGDRFKNLAINNNGTDDSAVGVAMTTFAAAEYGWLQTAGVGTILADESVGTVAAGTQAVVSDGVDGAAEPLNIAASNSQDDVAILNFAEQHVGHFLTAAVDTEYVAILLNISH